MSTLTKSNAQQHCLTCLLKLDIEHQPAADTKAAEQKCQQSSVNIAGNFELRQMLQCHLGWTASQLDELWMPQRLCIRCSYQLQGFDKFQQHARDCYELLQTLLKQTESDSTATFEVVYEHADHTVTDTSADDGIYTMLYKNTALSEPESVLLETTQADPFDTSRHNAHGEVDLATEVSEDVLATTPKASRCTRVSKTHVVQNRIDNQAQRNKGNKNSFKCTECRRSFAHMLTLNAHVLKVHEGRKRPFQCDRCDKSYSFMGGLYTHIKEIHDPEVRHYPCDHAGCDRVYTSFISMQKHKRMKHTALASTRKYVCEQCGATFNQTANLRYHRRTKHPTESEVAEQAAEDERHFCELCQKQFHSQYTLKYHIMRQHSDSKDQLQYECKECGRRVPKKFMLVQHMLTHSAEKMPCEHCGKLFVRKFELEAHIRAVHLKLKPFACKFCTECFASRKTLRHHEYIHTGEKPYVCDICGQSYRQQTCLKNHRKIHNKLVAQATSAPD